MKVTLFRAIDEMSTVIIGTEIKNALDRLRACDMEIQSRTVPRVKLPFDFDVRLRGHPITSDAVNSYFARLVYYPLAAKFSRADVYHITDDQYGALVRALDPRRCVVSMNHGTPEIFRSELGVGTGLHFRVQQCVFESVTRAAFIVTATEFIRQHILDHYPLSEERVVCNPYGCDESFHPRSMEIRAETRRRFNLSPDWFILLHVGNCGPNKNVETILRALSLLPEEIHFVQVGGEWSSAHQEIIASRKLENRVRRLGVVPHPALHERADLAEIYCASDAFVFPSLLEGFGLPIVEAMASGLPVITSDFGAMAEVGGDGAVLVNPREPEAIATVILEFHNSRECYERWRQAALTRAKDFSWHKHAERLYEMYKQVDASMRKP